MSPCTRLMIAARGWRGLCRRIMAIHSAKFDPFAQLEPL